MAKQIAYRLVRKTDTPEIIDGWDLPPIGEILQLPFDASGAGKCGGSPGAMELIQSHAFKVIDAKNRDGATQAIEITVTMRRMASDDDEHERIVRAVADKDKASVASKLRKAEESERLVENTKSLFREGQAFEAEKNAMIAAATAKQKPSTVEVVKEAVELATVLQSLTPKQLPAGQ